MKKLFKIIYSKKYRLTGARYHGRHYLIVGVASGRPKNALVKLRDNELAVIPWGNLRFERMIKFNRKSEV